MRKIYCNGTIRTMSGNNAAEAVLTDGESISAVGTFGGLRAAAPDAELVDLRGSAMLPAFIDAHSHFTGCATSFLQIPLEECCNFEEISRKIKDFIAHNSVKPGEWVVAKGYDHNSLREKRHPPLALLDAAAPDNPLALQHASGHAGVFNSAALRALNVTPDTRAPDGGRIGTENGGLTGYMEENAFISYIKKLPMNGMDELLGAYKKAQDAYAARGITTVQEGMAVAQLLPLYKLLLGSGILKLDLVAYAAMEDADAFFSAFPDAVNAYRGHFKLGGYKIVLDGSPQARTAWMRTPYLNEAPPYYGYGTMSGEDVRSAVKTASNRGMQLLAHCNGDAAARQFIDAVAAEENDAPGALRRPVMIHAQLLGTDQLAEVARLGIIPSFFAAHVFHWGDAHIENFGFERASRISPARSALEKGIMFTFHQDAPVIEPDMLETVWCAVNRVTSSGVSLGADERISVTEALKAVTINAAYQYGEEDRKGSIEPGKRADFVILERDPFAVEPSELRNIKILGTICGGETVYAAQ